MAFTRMSFRGTVRHWLARLGEKGRSAVRARALRERVRAILDTRAAPQAYDDRAVFDELQAGPQPPIVYGYDTFSTWRRGVERAIAIIERTRMAEPGKGVLEVGCGEGMTGAAVASFGHEVVLLDMEDWRDARATSLAFTTRDLAAPLDYPDGSFDLVFSYNVMEHVPDPDFVLGELVRVTRPGGAVYLDFDPLYASAWGLHAWRSLRMP